MRTNRWVLSRRGPKTPPDPWRPLAVLHEPERGPDGGACETSTVFLAGAECPLRCVFCDLWRSTLDGPTPQGAIPAQIETALAEIRHRDTLKLYNASNFFDRRAVPSADDEPIAELVGDFERVVVECHPRFVDERCFTFASRLEGRLEVAIGLETADAEALARLNKGMTLEQYEATARALADGGVDLRTFLLVGAPFVERHTEVRACLDSVLTASRAGSRVVTLIPARGGNGAMEELEHDGDWSPVDLGLVDECFTGALDLALDGCAVLVDLWDLERHESCDDCAAERTARLVRMSSTGRAETPLDCATCGR